MHDRIPLIADYLRGQIKALSAAFEADPEAVLAVARATEGLLMRDYADSKDHLST